MAAELMSNYQARTAPGEDAAVSSRRGRITSVCLEGHALLRILKHCREAFPVSVAGTLLGMDVETSGVCEVTNCFPAAPDDDGNEHPVRMMKALKEINVDYNSVGWYTSAYLGGFFTKDTVEHHVAYQLSSPNSVLLVYDNVPTTQGHLSIKALRLTDAFMDEWRAQTRLGSEAFTHLAPSAIFEELPLKIRNPHLIQAFLVGLIDSKALLSAGSGLGGAGGVVQSVALAGTAATGAAAAAAPGGSMGGAGGAAGGEGRLTPFSASGSVSASVGYAIGATPAFVAAAELDTDFARLDLSTAPYIEKHLDLLHSTTSLFLTAQSNARFVARDIAALVKDREDWLNMRRRENAKRREEGLDPLPEIDLSLPFFKPVTDKAGRDTLDSLLVAAQISAYCGSVNRFAGQSFGKLFAAASLSRGNVSV